MYIARGTVERTFSVVATDRIRFDLTRVASAQMSAVVAKHPDLGWVQLAVIYDDAHLRQQRRDGEG